MKTFSGSSGREINRVVYSSDPQNEMIMNFHTHLKRGLLCMGARTYTHTHTDTLNCYQPTDTIKHFTQAIYHVLMMLCLDSDRAVSTFS